MLQLINQHSSLCTQNETLCAHRTHSHTECSMLNRRQEERIYACAMLRNAHLTVKTKCRYEAFVFVCVSNKGDFVRRAIDFGEERIKKSMKRKERERA